MGSPTSSEDSLEMLLGPVAERLESRATVRATDLPRLPERTASQSIIITKSLMTYADDGLPVGYYRADVLNFLSTRDGYRVLAAALSCALIHRAARVVVDLVNPMSEIKMLCIRAAPGELSSADLRATAFDAFEWRLNHSAAIGALGELKDPLKPRFLLVHKDVAADHRRPWGARNHVHLVASEMGLMLLTSAVLDYALNGAVDVELACRAPPCPGSSLGAASAEARFWLPGSIHHGIDERRLRAEVAG